MFWKRLNYKYYLLIIIGYALLLTLAIGCVFMQTDRVYKQIDFLNGGDYQYTYQTTSSTKENDYLNCSSVYFYTDNGLSNSLLGDCLMGLENSTYNAETPIQLNKKLGSREIALSYNLAKQHNLGIGSKVYSKHNIKNVIEEYTIAEILPVSYGILRVDYNINYGVMLIGCDEDYISNTNYSYVGFSQEDPSNLIQANGAGLISLDVKELHHQELIQHVSLWQGIIILMVSSLTLLFVIIHWKNQKNYYAKLIINGCHTNTIKKQILLDIILPGIMGLLMALVFSVCVLSIYNLFFSYLASIFSIIGGLLTLIVSSFIISNKGRKI